jgi:hypothetical protein
MARLICPLLIWSCLLVCVFSYCSANDGYVRQSRLEYEFNQQGNITYDYIHIPGRTKLKVGQSIETLLKQIELMNRMLAMSMKPC